MGRKFGWFGAKVKADFIIAAFLNSNNDDADDGDSSNNNTSASEPVPRLDFMCNWDQNLTQGLSEC